MCSFICEVHFLKIGIYPRNFFWYDSLSKISLPLFPAPLIKLWGQNFNFRSFLWGTYRNSLFQFPLCSTRGFNNVRKVSFQANPCPSRSNLIHCLFICFSAGRFSCQCTWPMSAQRWAKGISEVHGGNGGITFQEHHWESCRSFKRLSGARWAFPCKKGKGNKKSFHLHAWTKKQNDKSWHCDLLPYTSPDVSQHLPACIFAQKWAK